MDICKTDMRTIIRILDDAARLYDMQHGQRYVCRAWVIRRLIEKLNRKIVRYNEQTGTYQQTCKRRGCTPK